MKTSSWMRRCCGLTIATTFALATPAYPASAEAGKTLYDDSCIHCHGAAGAGNPVQDKFWKMRIPRLNSAYVQKKSDDELGNVILNGKRKMKPAMLGQPENAHKTKVTAEQVPDLIAYIRSLAKK